MESIESFVACFPYTAVAALLPGERVAFQHKRESEPFVIERSNSGHGYIVTTLCGDGVEYFATAREVRERLIGLEPVAPLVVFN